MKKTLLAALLIATSCDAFAGNIVRVAAPISQGKVAGSTGSGDQSGTPTQPSTNQPETPAFRIKDPVPGRDGIYQISSNGKSFSAYVDMTTNGGYWVLALYWTNPLSFAPQMKNLAVTNNALVTWTADASKYPVLPSGLPNVAKQGMIVSTNPSWTSAYGAWQAFATEPASRVVGSGNPIAVTSPKGNISLYLPINGWRTDTFGNSGFGLFASPNNGGPCGGSGTEGYNRMCPGYQGSGSGSHFDMSYQKFYFLKGQ